MRIHTPLKNLWPSSPFVIKSDSKLTMQVVRYFDTILASGQISPGFRLPSERSIAATLKVSRNTVTAAYNELEQRGLIRRIRGTGSFRCHPQGAGDSFSWSGKVSSKAHLMDEPILELLARNSCSKVSYPLLGGTPSLDCFPTEAYQETVNRVIREDFPSALAVAPTEGQSRLRRAIGKWINVEPSRVMVTSGAQEAIDLVARCLIEPGDYAIVECPTYPGAIQCLRAAGAQLAGWETHWNLGELEKLILRYHPKLLFTTPSFQNPTGRVMSLATRKGLLDLASRYHLPIIEDDVYSKTYVNGRVPPQSLQHLDTCSQVISISTFSKMLAPGLRVGWIVAPLYMVKQLSLIKMRANLFTGGLNQLVLSTMLDEGSFDHHLDNLRFRHGVLRNAAIAAMEAAVGSQRLSFTSPNGGLYLWCKLPPGTDLDLFLETAEARGVCLAPGHAFFAEQPSHSFFRLCFTATTESQLVEGIAILTNTLNGIGAQAPN